MFSVALIVHAISITGVAVGIWINSGIFAAISVAAFIFSFAVGNGSMLFVYTSEILPSSGIGISYSSSWLTSALIGIGTGPLRDSVGTSWTFIGCAVLILIDLALFNYLAEESLGKSTLEIDEAFLGKNIAPLPKKIELVDQEPPSTVVDN